MSTMQKAMSRTLRAALTAMGFKVTASQSLELIAFCAQVNADLLPSASSTNAT
jgi:hypothetical protein